MENKEYTVVGRIVGWRAVRIKANSASEATKLARKLSAEEWIVGEIHISNDLTAHRTRKECNAVKEKIKNIVIEKMLNKTGESSESMPNGK
jgi:hypothetical protein